MFHVRIEKAAALAGLIATGLFLVLFWPLGDMIPPYDPSWSAAETAAHWAGNHERIQLALMLMIMVSALYAPFFALLARQIRRIEGYWGVMSLTQVMLGVTFPFGFMLCAIFGVAAAYRPDADPQVIRALSDMFWLIFVGLVAPLITQVVIVAFAVFTDRREKPSFPRWYGYFSVWYAILGVPGICVYVFKDGPLAWNGMFAFWIPLAAYCAWQVVTSIVLMGAVDVENEERAAATERGEVPAA